MITKWTTKIWRLFYCCNLSSDSLGLLVKYYSYIKTIVLFWFAKVWPADIEKIMKYYYFIKKMKKCWNRNFSRNLKNIALNIFIYLRLIFPCDIIHIRQFHMYLRYHQRMNDTLKNYFIRFNNALSFTFHFRIFFLEMSNPRKIFKIFYFRKKKAFEACMLMNMQPRNI